MEDFAGVNGFEQSCGHDFSRQWQSTTSAATISQPRSTRAGAQR